MSAINISQPPALAYEVLGDYLLALEERVLGSDKQRGIAKYTMEPLQDRRRMELNRWTTVENS